MRIWMLQAQWRLWTRVLGRRLVTEKQGSISTIVWNPWKDGAAQLADLGNEEWQQMLCVEGGNVLGQAVTLAPGDSHTMAVCSMCCRSRVGVLRGGSFIFPTENNLYV